MGFSETDLMQVAAILREAARVEIMPRFRALRPEDVRSKSGKQDLVTVADVAAEARIAQACQAAFPGVMMVGEEAAAGEPGLIAGLRGAAFAIVVDPIDGTSNFAAGLPLFGVMAAVVVNGACVGGVILDPVCDSFSWALAGQGAFERAADGSEVPLHVAPPVPVADMVGMVSWRFMPPALRAVVPGRMTRLSQSWDHRCAAHEYRLMLAGHSDVVVFNRLMPWDHLAGALLVREAGGYAARFDGSAYVPGDVDGGLICAADADAWAAVRQAIIGE